MRNLLPALALLSAPILLALTANGPVQRPRSSPPGTATYNKDGLKIEVNYSRPYKKGREIFGELVPYGRVWRTGANEATTFSTNQALNIAGKTLPAGKYTLWTIPNADNWQVIFNKRMYPWGINMEGEASRDPADDALEVTAPVEQTSKVVEQFTINVVDSAVPTLEFVWDRTQVSVPLK
ncbi:MAG: DUF2911 domain-containing protein [Bacteroidetes bacterium]|nr:DUF2911 domain-containing protein [Bacteroidota bacterium]MBS1943099.1 DUF2911 domain-containing protein [Bacteroidota bacterium]